MEHERRHADQSDEMRDRLEKAWDKIVSEDYDEYLLETEWDADLVGYRKAMEFLDSVN